MDVQLSTRVRSEQSVERICGLDPAALLAAIEAEEAADDDPSHWAAAPDKLLIDHIVEHYHARLRRDLPQIVEMAQTVERRHGERDDRLGVLAMHLASMSGELHEHMLKEERVLFPMILSGRGALAGAPVRAMEHEHSDAAADLRRTRELTDDLTAPDDACNTWRSLYLRLAALEAELKNHIHLENNVLFPRVIPA